MAQRRARLSVSEAAYFRELNRRRMASSRVAETIEQHEGRVSQVRHQITAARDSESPEQSELRRAGVCQYVRNMHANESELEAVERRVHNAEHMKQVRRRNSNVHLNIVRDITVVNSLATHYLGQMHVICEFCSAI